MQSLWSRAAGQAHLCGCRGCHQIARGMTRPSTTRAVRRKVTFGEAFTALYSTIMGTAVMVDAKFKDDRRKDLMRQIDEVKADLERLGLGRNTAPLPDADPTEAPPSGDIHNRYEGCWQRSPRQQRGIAEFFDSLGDVSTWDRTIPRSAELDTWWKASGLPDPVFRRGRTDYEALQQKLELEELDFSIAHRNPKNGIQLQMRERLTRSLVRHLLRKVELKQIADTAGLKTLLHNTYESSSPRIHQRLEEEESRETDPSRRALRRMIVEDVYPKFSPTIIRKGRESIAEATRDLNESIRAIFANRQPMANSSPTEEARNLVVKIGHNLLVAPSPPTVHTLSTMALEFDRLGHHEVANVVVVHLLYHTLLEPTQQTLVVLFNHYKELGNLARFGQLIRRCTALDEKPLRIRGKWFHEISESPYLQKWAKVKDVAVHHDRVYERAWLSNPLINTILDGLLHFDCLGQAVQVAAFCWGKGIRICTATVNQLLDQCMHALDADAAFGVLGAFFRNPHNLWPTLKVRERGEFLVKLQRLMDLCGIDASAAELLAQDRSALAEESAAVRRTRQRTLQTLRIKRGVDVAQHVIEASQAAIEAFEARETPEEMGEEVVEASSQPASPVHQKAQGPNMMPAPPRLLYAQSRASARGPLLPLGHGVLERASRASAFERLTTAAAAAYGP